MIEHEQLVNWVVDSLILSHEEASAQHESWQQLGAHLLYAVWYIEPNKDRATEDLEYFLSRRLYTLDAQWFSVGRAIIPDSDTVGVGVWIL